MHLFGGLTSYGVNVVYVGWNTVDILGGHIEFGGRYYQLWGLFIDQRFGLGRWLPLLLAVSGTAMRMVLALVIVQIPVATFVAITMMGWWFPGRTLVTVLPFFSLPVALLITKAPLWGRIPVALLGVLTLGITYSLALAGRSGEITVAVDPFDMAFSHFPGLAGLFPLYTWWTTETWWLTIFWLVMAVLRAGAILRTESLRPARRPRLLAHASEDSTDASATPIAPIGHLSKAKLKQRLGVLTGNSQAWGRRLSSIADSQSNSSGVHRRH